MANFLKEKDYVVTRDVETATADGTAIRRITVVGTLVQSTLKRCIKVYEAVTTRGVENTLVENELITLPVDLYGSKKSIRKELFMGYSICDPADLKNNEYNKEEGIRLAKRRMSKPLETSNFTFLNEDMVMAILNNELDYIQNHLDKYINRQKRGNSTQTNEK